MLLPCCAAGGRALCQAQAAAVQDQQQQQQLQEPGLVQEQQQQQEGWQWWKAVCGRRRCASSADWLSMPLAKHSVFCGWGSVSGARKVSGALMLLGLFWVLCRAQGLRLRLGGTGVHGCCPAAGGGGGGGVAQAGCTGSACFPGVCFCNSLRQNVLRSCTPGSLSLVPAQHTQHIDKVTGQSSAILWTFITCNIMCHMVRQWLC